jgi:adenylate cyclase
MGALLATGDIFLFDGFRLDRRGGGLFREDERGVFAPLPIGSRALDVLGVLVERPGDLVSRDEIISAVWPETVVEDSNLPVQIRALRRVLDQGRAEGSCLQTVAGRGYRLVATVTRRAADVGSNTAAVLTSAARPSPRVSIVVLPFTNLGDDPDQEYFADGITDDLTTDLSRISGSFVIARSTAFTFKGKATDARQIGRELGVRYVLEGSIRRSGSQVRVNVQLVDAETGAHLWADRFDRDTGDLFGLQNEITGRIARSLQFELTIAEAGSLTEHPDALAYILRARALWWKPISKEYDEAVSLLERALALDPRAVEAQIWFALMLINRVINLTSGAPDVDIQRADELIARALAVSPNSAWAHYVKGQVLRAKLQYEDAAIEYETAIALDRNLANAYAWLGRCKLLLGSVDEVIPGTEYAIRLSPHDRNVGFWYWQIGAVHLLEARTDEAIRWLEKARSYAHAGFPITHFIHASLAAGYALKGETKRASVALGEALKLSDRYASMTHLKAAPGGQWFEAPKLHNLVEATYFAGLRKAGMPEEKASEPAGGLSWSRAAGVKLVLSEGWLQLIDFFAGATV